MYFVGLHTFSSTETLLCKHTLSADRELKNTYTFKTNFQISPVARHCTSNHAEDLLQKNEFAH